MPETPAGRSLRPVGLWIGLFLLLIGLAVGGYGGWRVAKSIYNEATLEPLKVVELIPGQVQQIKNLQVDATRRVQLAVQLEVADPGELSPTPEYQYPFTYRVVEPGGVPLFEQDGSMANDQGLRITRKTGENQQPLLQIEHRLQSMQVPFPGVIDVEFSLGPAAAASVRPLKLSLLIYDRVSNDVRGIIIGGSLLAVASLVALFGLVLLLVQALSGKGKVVVTDLSADQKLDQAIKSAGEAAQAAPGQPPLTDSQIRNIAMWCHLSALAGFLMPFGSILGPLVVWLTQRDKSPFIDDQGKEAINFQLSIMVYAAVSILLILILVGFLLLMALSFGALVLVIIAALQANQGIAYRYPLIIRFIR